MDVDTAALRGTRPFEQLLSKRCPFNSCMAAFVHGLDLLDGTPVIDIKPYIPYCDSFAGLGELTCVLRSFSLTEGAEH